MLQFGLSMAAVVHVSGGIFNYFRSRVVWFIDCSFLVMQLAKEDIQKVCSQSEDFSIDL